MIECSELAKIQLMKLKNAFSILFFILIFLMIGWSCSSENGGPGDIVSGTPTATVAISAVSAGSTAGEIMTVGSGAGAIEFCWIPSSSFEMGSSSGEEDEAPVHLVTLTAGFWMARYETTQAQWAYYMGSVPSIKYGGGDNYPVYSVSSWDIKKTGGFLNLFNYENRIDAADLPTEAQWEYACRAATTSTYYWGASANASYANGDEGRSWPNDGYKSLLAPVGQFFPNAWGLYDMSGNLWEWCKDAYQSGYYAISIEHDPVIISTQSQQVLRGGCWRNNAADLRSANRGKEDYDNAGRNFGFRLVLNP